MDIISDDRLGYREPPSPHDFGMYLPWACGELGIDVNLVITKVMSLEKPTSESAKSKKATGPRMSKHDQQVLETKGSVNSEQRLAFTFQNGNTVKITAVYDILDHLIQIKFEKNKKVPSKIFKLIGLFIHYHTFVRSVVIKGGIDNESLYEINKLLAVTNIADLCLDNAAICDGRYELLLEGTNQIKYLSMARCQINDTIAERIAKNLTFPEPGSKTLLVLNLSSNLITDTGAKYLAKTLRTNRQLQYLNLAGNKITDEGASEIFDALKVFLVTEEEVVTFRKRNMQYIRDVNNLAFKIAQELKDADFDKQAKRKATKPLNPVTKSPKKVDERELKPSVPSKLLDLEFGWLEKAKVIAKNKMGVLLEPFSGKSVFIEDGLLYCYGNNRLAYINVSYNNMTFITVKKILSVLITQQDQNRSPKGLIKVSIEGNFIPEKCRELEQINAILLSNFLPDKGDRRRTRTDEKGKGFL